MSNIHPPYPEQDEPLNGPSTKATFWPIAWSSYDPRGRHTTTDRLRRVVMLLTLVAYIIGDCLGFYVTIRTSPTIFAVTMFLFVGVMQFFYKLYCLAIVGDAVGGRTVLGVRVGRKHFDAFMVLLALVVLASCVCSFLHNQELFYIGHNIMVWNLAFGIVNMVFLIALIAISFIARQEDVGSVTLQ